MAFGNYFKDYFYGKSGKADYTEQDMPKNRIQLFRAVLAVRRGSMVGLNLLYLLFWLPAILWTALNLVQLNYYVSATDIELTTTLFHNLLFSWLLVLAPLIALTGPFRAGISRVCRNWARDEHSFVLADFKEGVRNNWKQGLALGAVRGLMPLLAYICTRFYSVLAGDNVLYYLPLFVILFAATLYVLADLLTDALMISYRLRWRDLIKNSVLMTLAALPRAIGIKLLTLALPVLLVLFYCFLPTVLNYALPITLALYALFMLSFNRLLIASYANALCEKYLNSKIEGAAVNIGLRPKESEESHS